MQKKSIQPGQKLAFKLTTAERKFIVEELMCFDEIYEQLIVGTPADEPLMMTLDELDDFSGYIAAEANHCDDRKKQKKLDAVFEKADNLLDTYTDEESSQTISFDDAKRAKLISDQAVQVAEWAAQALVAAEQLRIKTKPLEHFSLAPAYRDVLLLVPGISKSIKNRLLKDNSSFTVAEVGSMIMAMAEDLPDGDAGKQVALMFVAKHLMDSLQDGILRLSEQKKSTLSKAKVKSARAKTATGTPFQLKITLLGSEPAIWRRIQIEDCTLDKLHEDIQTSMGWTNSHLHQFEINGERYGDPELIDDGFDDSECVDSTKTMLSEIVPKSGKRFVFKYEYDFGDGWVHEVLFEGCPSPEKGKKYPICLEGERACPPEDIGGVLGYAEYLEALADPSHEQHSEFLDWRGQFDPEDFDAAKVTREMKRRR